MILNRIVDFAKEKGKGLTLVNIIMGLEYVAVELSDGSLGCSYLFKEESGTCCKLDHGRMQFEGIPVPELVTWALDERELIRSSVGIAVMNALFKPESIKEKSDKDAVLELPFKKTDLVGMVGYFKPMVKQIVDKVKDLYIFERKPNQDNPSVFPDWSAYSILPRCDIVIISGTTNINKTQDVLVSCCTKAREIAIVGPSTLMYPEFYKGSKVTLLAGAYAPPEKREDIYKVVTRGGGGFGLLEYLQKYSIRV